MLIRMRHEERGFVMVTVLLVTFVLLLATTAILDRAVGSQFVSRHDQDWNAALAAAEAGIDDYLYRTNNSAVIPPLSRLGTSVINALGVCWTSFDHCINRGNTNSWIV